MCSNSFTQTCKLAVMLLRSVFFFFVDKLNSSILKSLSENNIVTKLLKTDNEKKKKKRQAQSTETWEWNEQPMTSCPPPPFFFLSKKTKIIEKVGIVWRCGLWDSPKAHSLSLTFCFNPQRSPLLFFSYHNSEHSHIS